MRKPLSTMTAQEFIEAMGALDLNGRELATALDRHPSLITRYQNGQPIPTEIAQRLAELLAAKRREIERVTGQVNATVGSMIVYSNQRKKPRLHQAQGRFMRRQRPPDKRTYPVYRMSVERFKVYIEALSKWQIRVRELALQYTDETRQRDYALELADLRSLAESAPRHAPYDVCIQRNEWDVVSRALRHFGTDAANNLRIHWGKYKNVGFPRNRKIFHEEAQQASAQAGSAD